MHDGRFITLEEVVDHYNEHAKYSTTADILLQYNLQSGGLKLSSQDKADLLSFLRTLTDQSYLNNISYSKPN